MDTNEQCAAPLRWVSLALVAILAAGSARTMAGSTFDPANASIVQLRDALDGRRVSSPSYSCASDDSYKPGYIASTVGFPEVTVPAGRISANIPVGYSFMGAPYGEARLLSLAHAFQNVEPRFPAPALAD